MFLRLLEPPEPGVRESVSRTIRSPTRRVHLAVRLYQQVMITHFAATLSKIANELFTTLQLCRRRLTTVEIADKTDAERNVVKVIAVDVAAIDLPPPAITHFDLAIACGSAVADHEMVGQPVLHMADMAMVVIEDARVPLPCPTVVDDNELPPRISPVSRRPVYLGAHRSRQIAIAGAAAGASIVAMKESIPKARARFGAAFLDRQLCRVSRGGIVRRI